MGWCAQHCIDGPQATSEDVGAYFASRRDRIAAVTLLGVRSSLRYYYGWLVSEGQRPDDPCAAIHIDTPSSPAKQPFSPDDLHLLIAACRTARERALVLVLLDTGLRPAELLRMRSEHIDWEHGMMRVLGKRGRDRMLCLGSRSLAALRQYVNGGSGPAWTTGTHTPMSLETLYFIIRRLGQRANVAAYPRRFRTTFATRMYKDSGGDFLAVKLLLGHTRAATTERYLAWGAMELALAQQRKYALGDRLAG